MNYKKTIKDLKEFNSQLKGQYSNEQNRSYCLQCKIDKLEKEKQELIEYLKEKIESSKGNDTVINGMYFKSMSRCIYEEILSKIEKR